MKSRLLFLGLVAGFLGDASGDAGTSWPSFRGPQARGHLPKSNPPVTWSLDPETNIRWKTAVPGLGHSSPVISGDHLFLTTAVSRQGAADLKVGLYGDIKSADDNGVQQWKVLCLRTTDGRLEWQKTAHEGRPGIKRHTKASHANATPVTDGKRVVAFFGSEGLHCFTTRGDLVWKKDLGTLDSGYYRVKSAQWGFASSPVIHAGKVVVQCDVQEDSFLAAFSLEDGRELWRTVREDVPTWSTPTIMVHDNKPVVLVNGFKHMGAYDLADGRERWRLGGGGDIPVPTPIVAEGLIFFNSAHGRQRPIFAVRPTAVGDISLQPGTTANEHIAWSVPRGGNYMQTPIVVNGLLFCCYDNGVLSCYDAQTGQRHFQERLDRGGDGFTASAVAAGDRLYFPSERGKVYVVRAAREFEVLAVNDMQETCMATPALNEDTLFLRTRGHLVAIGK